MSSEKDKITQIKKKIIFALLMGSITTGIISFSLILINIGYDENFFSNWFKSWAYAYLFVIPAILFIAPPVEKFVEFIITKAS